MAPRQSTFLLLIASAAVSPAFGQVAHGGLDPDRPTEKRFEASESSKSASFTIPAGQMIHATLSDKEARLREVGGDLRVDIHSDTGKFIYLYADRSLSAVDVAKVEKGEQDVVEQIVTALKENEALLEIKQLGIVDYSELDLRLLRPVQWGRQKGQVLFAQHIGGVPVDTSYLRFYSDGRLGALKLQLANPNHPTFDRKAWLPEETLINLAYEASGLAVNRDAIGEEAARFNVIFDWKTESFRPALITVVGAISVAIDAVTGETLYTASVTVG